MATEQDPKEIALRIFRAIDNAPVGGAVDAVAEIVRAEIERARALRGE